MKYWTANTEENKRLMPGDRSRFIVIEMEKLGEFPRRETGRRKEFKNPRTYESFLRRENDKFVRKVAKLNGVEHFLKG